MTTRGAKAEQITLADNKKSRGKPDPVGMTTEKQRKQQICAAIILRG
jgi:hypothetical protein